MGVDIVVSVIAIAVVFVIVAFMLFKMGKDDD